MTQGLTNQMTMGEAQDTKALQATRNAIIQAKMEEARQELALTKNKWVLWGGLVGRGGTGGSKHHATWHDPNKTLWPGSASQPASWPTFALFEYTTA